MSISKSIAAWAKGAARKAATEQSACASSGEAAEARALDHLLAQGLRLVKRNYRVARGPGRRAGEIDLIMRDRDGTLVFVEVRARRSRSHGGAAASVGASKRRSVIFAAQQFIAAQPAPPPCRFDVVAIDEQQLTWLKAAFDLGP